MIQLHVKPIDNKMLQFLAISQIYILLHYIYKIIVLRK